MGDIIMGVSLGDDEERKCPRCGGRMRYEAITRGNRVEGKAWFCMGCPYEYDEV